MAKKGTLILYFECMLENLLKEQAIPEAEILDLRPKLVFFYGFQYFQNFIRRANTQPTE